MTIEAMKLALEALKFGLHVGFDESSESQIKKGGKAFDQHSKAITAINAAIEQADDLEAWKTSDTAYRPEGLPQDFIKHEVENEGDWSEWVCPDPEQYFMQCCDCGLVHKMQFKVVKYSEGDECEPFNDPNVQVVFRARRHEVAEKHEPRCAVIVEVFAKDWRLDYMSLPVGKHRLYTQEYVYTTPPAAQRQWVGLTDEDFENAFQETYIMGDSDLQDFAKVIEAKLKEKNT